MKYISQIKLNIVIKLYNRSKLLHQDVGKQL